MAGYYQDGPLSPAQEYVELDGDYPKAEDLEAAVAPENYRKGYDGATDEITTTEFFEDSTVAELKGELEDRGLATSGNKPDLIERLAADEANDE